MLCLEACGPCLLSGGSIVIEATRRPRHVVVVVVSLAFASLSLMWDDGMVVVPVAGNRVLTGRCG